MEFEIYFKFILSFALILIAARIGGEIAERYLKQPSVLGELVAGIIISPFALGLLIDDPIILNFATVNAFGVHELNIMEIVSQIALDILLFVAGVETDVRAFLKRVPIGSAVALGGVVLPFIFGYLVTWALYPQVGSTGWLFMGAVLTATSIGVTVRVLMDMGRLQTAEGNVILAGAVIDDIIGVVILSVAISMAKTGGVDVGHVIQVGVIGFVLWFALLMAGIRFRRYITRILLDPFKRSGTTFIVAILIGFIIAYLVTLVDLHPVVGAYVAGLMFAATEAKQEIARQARPVMVFLAPFFFCYLGMQVDMPLLAEGAVLAVILIVLATVGKIVGCYLPSRFVGKLSRDSSLIVGVGMVPRAEVGLIIAGAGLLAGAVDRELFGVAVAVSIITTLITPTMLRFVFRRVPHRKVESGFSPSATE